MHKKGFFRNKKGEGETLVDSPVIFLVLNILFFSILLFFIFKQSTGAFVYEQGYAKQIAILLDSAKPGMAIYVNLTQGIEVAKSNNWDINNIVKIDDDTNSVSVKLASRGGYKTQFFSDYKVDFKFEGNFFVMNINSKTGEEKTETKTIDVLEDFVNKYGENPVYEFKGRNLDEIKTAINYAKNNVVGKDRKCLCGNDCDNYAQFIYNAANNPNSKIDDALLLVAIMIQETNCDKTQKSNSSFGLMQINTYHCGKQPELPADKTQCHQILLTDTNTNINIGARILRDMYNTYKNGKTFTGACTEKYKTKTYSGWESALRGYNGWGCGKYTNDKGEIIKMVEQDSYVEQVMAIYNQLASEVKNA